MSDIAMNILKKNLTVAVLFWRTLLWMLTKRSMLLYV